MKNIHKTGFELAALIWDCETLKELYYLKDIFEGVIEKRAEQLQILEYVKKGEYVKE